MSAMSGINSIRLSALENHTENTHGVAIGYVVLGTLSRFLESNCALFTSCKSREYFTAWISG